MFHKNEFSVKRRFSDFLGLHSKLASKYLHVGYIVPPAPEKSIVGKHNYFAFSTRMLNVSSKVAERSRSIKTMFGI